MSEISMLTAVVIKKIGGIIQKDKCEEMSALSKEVNASTSDNVEFLLE